MLFLLICFKTSFWKVKYFFWQFDFFILVCFLPIQVHVACLKSLSDFAGVILLFRPLVNSIFWNVIQELFGILFKVRFTFPSRLLFYISHDFHVIFLTQFTHYSNWMKFRIRLANLHKFSWVRNRNQKYRDKLINHFLSVSATIFIDIE